MSCDKTENCSKEVTIDSPHYPNATPLACMKVKPTAHTYTMKVVRSNKTTKATKKHVATTKATKNHLKVVDIGEVLLDMNKRHPEKNITILTSPTELSTKELAHQISRIFGKDAGNVSVLYRVV